MIMMSIRARYCNLPPLLPLIVSAISDRAARGALFDAKFVLVAAHNYVAAAGVPKDETARLTSDEIKERNAKDAQVRHPAPFVGVCVVFNRA